MNLVEKETYQENDYSIRLDSLIRETETRTFSGVVLVTQRGETKYARTYGYSDYESKTPISLTDNFKIQSNSKQMTAVLALKEIEKGKIDINSPIRKYLPGLKQNWADRITVHQLMNMTCGIASIYEPLIFEPGTKNQYCNSAYILVGRILQNVTGQQFTKLVHDLFQELGMENSFCLETAKEDDRVINGYEDSKNGFSLFDIENTDITEYTWNQYIPVCGIVSNLQDLEIWNAKLHGGKLLKPETYRLMLSYDASYECDALGNDQVGYGYGISYFVQPSSSLEVLGHKGLGAGFTSILFYFPKEEVAVTVLENVCHESEDIVYHFEDKIRDIIIRSSLVLDRFNNPKPTP